MSDPVKLIQGPRTSLEVALLLRARREAPSKHARDRMLQLLGISATASAGVAATAKIAAAATVAKPATTSLTAAFVAKWAFVGSAGALITVGAVRQVPRLLHSNPRSEPAVSVTELRSSSPSVVGTAAVSEASEVSANNAELQASGDTHALPNRARQNSTARPTADTSLAAEVAAIDRVRAALAVRDAVRALALLDGYYRQFPNGSLWPESQLLRVEALVRSGRRAEALPLARRLLNADPHGPLSERIRSLLPELD